MVVVTVTAAEKHNGNLSVNLSSDGSLEDNDSMENQNLQWAQGKQGWIVFMLWCLRNTVGFSWDL